MTGCLRVTAGLHVLGLGGLVAQPRNWPLFAALLVGNHAVLAAASVWPRSRLLGPNLRRLPPAHAARGEVALTFDDGPDPAVTPAVLDVLTSRGITSTFFCIGERAERHPQLVAEIVRRGHSVENHTYSHGNGFALRGPWAMGREIDRAQRVLAELTGRPPRWFRAPAGMRNPWLADVLSARNLALASWTRRGFDTVTSDADRVVARLTRRVRAGDVLLLHDGSAARDPHGHPAICRALPLVLDRLALRKLRPVPLPAPG